MNPSSLTAGLVDHVEVDPSAIRQAFEGQMSFTTAAQDRMDRGTLVGIMLTQPERLATDVAIWDGGRRAGAEWDNFVDEHGDQLIVTRKDFNTCQDACRQFRFNPTINELLSDIDVEVEILTKEGNIFCSGQVDAITRGRHRKIIDLKTTEAGISSKSVERTIRDFNYREKMAAYKYWFERETGDEVLSCWNLFLKYEPPLAIRIVKFDTASLQWGYLRIQHALESVERCLQSGQWPIFAVEDIASVSEWELGDGELEGLENVA